jgi:hypothetical protein
VAVGQLRHGQLVECGLVRSRPTRNDQVSGALQAHEKGHLGRLST